MKKFIRKFHTINKKEIDHFSKLSQEWWNPKGPFKTLHQLNPLRMGFMKNCLVEKLSLNDDLIEPLKDLKILDVGCGGGLVSESFARMGSNVLGVDASQELIQVSTIHASKQDFVNRITYKNSSVEDISKEYESSFDVISAMEVIEHVENVNLFLESLIKMLKPGGSFFISTLNKSAKSYLLAIVGAEYVLNIVPRGTHDWNKFITPENLTLKLEENGLNLEKAMGIQYNPLTENFTMNHDLSVNYIMYLTKNQ